MEQVKSSSVYRSPWVWVFTTYFAEGFPFTIIRSFSSLFFRSMNVRLESIGLTSLYALPWIIKFLWAPYLDKVATKRRWMLVMQFGIVATLCAVTLLTPFSFGVQAIAFLFFIGAFISATNDIAIDGYYLEALNSDGQARFVGFRIMAYRVAMIAGMGGLAFIGPRFGWYTAFACATILFGIVFLYHFFFLPLAEREDEGVASPLKIFRPTIIIWGIVIGLVIAGIQLGFRSGVFKAFQASHPALKRLDLSHVVGILLLITLMAIILMRNRLVAAITRDPNSVFSKAFVNYMAQEKIGLILAFVILFRVGESMLMAMLSPFFVDLGIAGHVWWIVSVVGLPCSIIGAMIGGFAISRYGLDKVIWPFVAAQNFVILIYMALALHLEPLVVLNTNAVEPQPIGLLNIFWVMVVHGVDQLAAGLGMAVLTTVLMRICQKEFKATHYAIGSGLMSLGGLFAGVFGGFLAGWLGYAYFFGISFVASIPGMLMIAGLPDSIYRRKKVLA